MKIFSRRAAPLRDSPEPLGSSGDRYYTTVAHQTGALTIGANIVTVCGRPNRRARMFQITGPLRVPKPPGARLNFLGGHLCGSSIRRSWFYGSRPRLADSIPPDSHRLTLGDIVSVEGIGETALSPDGKMIAIVRAGQIALRLSSEGGWPVTLTVSTGGQVRPELVPGQSPGIAVFQPRQRLDGARHRRPTDAANASAPR